MTYDKKTDDELLDLFRKRKDQDALGHLFLRYMELIYGVCLKYLDQPASAQDAVMDIYEHIQRKLPGQQVSQFPGWLYRVSVNHCLQLLRRKNRLETLPIDDKLVQFMPDGHLEDGFPDLDAAPDQVAMLEDCIRQLPEGQRDCIRMFYFEKTSYAEISKNTGMPLDTVRSHIQNGRRNLKKCMLTKTRHGAGSDI